MKLVTIGLTFFCLFVGQASAQSWVGDYQWKLKRDKAGIKIYTSKIPDSKYKAVRSTMVIETNTSSLVGLIMDLPNCSRWASMCKEARVEERLSPTETRVYSLNDVPFPARNRDMYANVRWSLNADTGKVSMRSRAIKGQYPKTKGVIRVEDAVSEWSFTPMPDGLVLVESFAHVDPNGPAPPWLINLLLIDSPYKSMVKIRKLIEAGNYQGTEVAFIPTG